VITTFLLFLFAILGTTMILAENEVSGDNTSVTVSVNETEDNIVGSSCGTVTPGYQDECCQNKGYSGWDSENFTCIGEPVQERDKNRERLGSNWDDEDANNSDNGNIACTADAKMCPDGTYVSRTGPHCEFAPCPREYNISKEKVCCKVYGYGSNMTEVNVHYKITEKRECTVPDNFVGGDREIVDDSYCIEQLKEKRQKFLDNIEEIMRERNRIKNYYINQSECPEECSCSGSTIKCGFENGSRIMTVYAGNSGNVIVQIKNVNASTKVTLYKSDGKVYGVFRNNETHEIILPDEVRERIKEREQDREERRVNWTDENITLNEDGYYYFRAHKKARLFWIVPVKERYHSQIDSETGEVIHVRKAWWGFLARDVKS
jgi:hypothetical protein